MKKIWYAMVKAYVRLGFFFYYKKTMVEGLENIPPDKAVLFVANHQNALVDPLLVGAYTPRVLNFLTRADVFRKPLIRKLLSTVNMMPIFRIRDGREGLSRNEEVFQKCYKILAGRGTILIFPEGNHNIQRRIRPLSKGFTRIVFGAIERNPELEVYVQPIGLNYSNARKYGSSVNLIYGKPVLANTFYEKGPENGASAALTKEISNRLKALVTHIEDAEKHDFLEKCFAENEFLSPEEVNKRLAEEEALEPLQVEDKKGFNLLRSLVEFNSILPLAVWKAIYPKIEEEEFIATFKFAISVTVFPIFYFLQASLVAWIFGGLAGLAYLLLSFVGVYLATRFA